MSKMFLKFKSYISCTIPFEQEVIDQIDNKNVVLNVGLNSAEKKVIEILIYNSNVYQNKGKIGSNKSREII